MFLCTGGRCKIKKKKEMKYHKANTTKLLHIISENALFNLDSIKFFRSLKTPKVSVVEIT